MSKRLLVLALMLTSALSSGMNCSGGSEEGPSVSLTINGIDEDLNDLLILSSSAFGTVNGSFAAGAFPVDPDTFFVEVIPWGGGVSVPLFTYWADEQAGVALIAAGSLAPGTYTALAWLSDTAGNTMTEQIAFAVRDFAGQPPIATGQKIWLDFTSDRDAVPGADFPVDLESFGLASPSGDPGLEATVETWVIDAILARLDEAYGDLDPLQLAFPDPVQVSFHASDPGGADVTRICVGGEDPTGGSVIGSISIDPNNGNRSSVECSTLPPTGIFPREMTVYSNQQPFKETFDPLTTSRGGTPVGEHPLDPVVLAPGFDPSEGTPEEVARWDDIQLAVVRFGDALGSIVAHEAGHALGLVMPGAPGGGLYGGSTGTQFSHDVEADLVSNPPENYLMNSGSTFNFKKLAGIEGKPRPVFRAIDHAYLRDRLILDSQITGLYPPPVATDVDPALLTGSSLITLTGANLVGTPSIRLENETFAYSAIGESLVSPTEMTAWVITSQVLPGVYDVVVENPDGQSARLEAAITVE